MNAVRHGVIHKSYKFVIVLGFDVDHMRGFEVGRFPINRDTQRSGGEQGQVIERVRVAVLGVASLLEVHLARKQIGHAANLDVGLVGHISVTGISPDGGVGGSSGSGSD